MVSEEIVLGRVVRVILLLSNEKWGKVHGVAVLIDLRAFVLI